MGLTPPQFTAPREKPSFTDYLKQGFAQGLSQGVGTAVSAPLKDMSQAYFIEGPRLEQQQKQFESKEGRLGLQATAELKAETEAKRLERERKADAADLTSRTKIFNNWVGSVTGPILKLGPEDLVSQYEKELASQEITVRTKPGRSGLDNIAKRMSTLQTDLDTVTKSLEILGDTPKAGQAQSAYEGRRAELEGRQMALEAAMEGLRVESQKPEAEKRETDVETTSKRYRNPAKIALLRKRLQHETWKSQVLILETTKELARILLPHQEGEHSVYKSMERMEQLYRAREPKVNAETPPPTRRRGGGGGGNGDPPATPPEAVGSLDQGFKLFRGLSIGNGVYDAAERPNYMGHPQETLASSARGLPSTTKLPKRLGERLVKRQEEYQTATTASQKLYTELAKVLAMDRDTARVLSDTINKAAVASDAQQKTIRALFRDALNFVTDDKVRGQIKAALDSKNSEVLRMLNRSLSVGRTTAAMEPKQLHVDFKVEGSGRLKPGAVSDSLTYLAEWHVMEAAREGDKEGLEALLNSYGLTMTAERRGMLSLSDTSNYEMKGKVDRLFADIVDLSTRAHQDRIIDVLLGGHNNDTFRREMKDPVGGTLRSMINKARARARGRRGQ